jgi:hypothetical protein
MQLMVTSRACSTDDRWQFSGKRIEPIRRGQPWRRSSPEPIRRGQPWRRSSPEPIRRGQPWRRSSTECSRWRKLRGASFLDGCFRGNSDAELREASSTRRNLQVVLTERGHWSLLRRPRSISLANDFYRPMLIAAGVVVSTNRSERVTPTTRSMVNGLASACPATALLAMVEDVVFARRLRSEGATRRKGLFDVRKYSAISQSFGSNLGVTGLSRSNR